MTTAGELLYNYLAEKHKDKLFTERHVMIAVELARLSDDEFDFIIGVKRNGNE